MLIPSQAHQRWEGVETRRGGPKVLPAPWSRDSPDHEPKGGESRSGTVSGRSSVRFGHSAPLIFNRYGHFVSGLVNPVKLCWRGGAPPRRTSIATLLRFRFNTRVTVRNAAKFHKDRANGFLLAGGHAFDSDNHHHLWRRVSAQGADQPVVSSLTFSGGPSQPRVRR